MLLFICLRSRPQEKRTPSGPNLACLLVFLGPRAAPDSQAALSHSFRGGLPALLGDSSTAGEETVEGKLFLKGRPGSPEGDAASERHLLCASGDGLCGVLWYPLWLFMRCC